MKTTLSKILSFFSHWKDSIKFKWGIIIIGFIIGFIIGWMIGWFLLETLKFLFK
ncbi:MAG TPA: hypothetical protein PKD00_11205 [Burkholderiales bacterium]|nr:hypothetical protein [Burkholderiales bacterium]